MAALPTLWRLGIVVYRWVLRIIILLRTAVFTLDTPGKYLEGQFASMRPISLSDDMSINSVHRQVGPRTDQNPVSILYYNIRDMRCMRHVTRQFSRTTIREIPNLALRSRPLGDWASDIHP